MTETCTGTSFSTAFVTSTGTGGPPPPAAFFAVELEPGEQPLLKTPRVAKTRAALTNPALQANHSGFIEDGIIAVLIFQVKRRWRISVKRPGAPSETPRRTLPGR